MNQTRLFPDLHFHLRGFYCDLFRVSTTAAVFYLTPQRLLTSSLLGTLLHPHLLPEGVNWYEVDGTHARVGP